MLQSITDWISSNQILVATMSVSSLMLFFCSIVAAPWIIARLPADYFVQIRPRPSARGPRRWFLWLARNTVGLLLMLVGVIMVITPGPGLLIFVVGLSVCDFRRKHHLLRTVAKRPEVFDSLNWLRKKASKPPFLR